MGAQGQGADAVSGRWVLIPRVLVFVFNGDDVLLMKRGAHRRVFPNKYNGLGGHVERDEHPAETAVREVFEESGLRVRDVKLRGIHHIDAGAAESGIVMYVFTARADVRALTAETGEGTLHWIPLSQVAGLDVVEDLPLVLPRILAMDEDAPPYLAHVSYDAQDQIIIRVAGGEG
jgi:8-oxo-dGTP diphosphatase